MRGGANDAYLASLHRELQIDGIDYVDEFFCMLNDYADEEIKRRVSLAKGDIYALDQSMRGKYDGIISMQTLSWLEDWKKPLEIMCGVYPEWIGLSSLFYEGKLDYQIKIKDYEEEGLTQPYTEKYYNIYPLPLIREFLAEKGYSNFVYEPFEIDIDIPKPDHLNVGTYTVKTEHGNRLQISGALMMPWYFVYASRK